MTGHYNQEKKYKDVAITAAKELRYSQDVIAKLEEAETDAEIEHIMHDARHGRR